MFAPEDVFNEVSNKPRVFYYPSPITATGPVLPTADIPQKTPKLNLKAAMLQTEDVHYGPNKENKMRHPVLQENASTSIDDLIKHIDDSLAVEPLGKTPVARGQPDIKQILSVSDNSDTNIAVVSPSSLGFFVNRFKHGKPTHPSKRDNDQKMKPSAQYHKLVPPSESPSDSISYNSVELDTSSFLSLQISSDDTTTESSTTATTDSWSEVTPIKPDRSEPLPKTSQPQTSFIEQLTGKSFSELASLVPKEVIEPSCDSEDILFQWRLKRRITDAQTSRPSAPEQADFSIPSDRYYNRGLEFYNHADKTDIGDGSLKHQNQHEAPPGPTKTVFREIDVQTDKEKTDMSCQVNLQAKHKTKSPRRSPRKSHKSPLKSHPSPRCQRSEPPTKSASKQLILDSDSDVTVSSFSDDLTNISDLDDIDDIDNDIFHEVDTTISDRETPTPIVPTPEKKEINTNNPIIENPSIHNNGLLISQNPDLNDGDDQQKKDSGSIDADEKPVAEQPPVPDVSPKDHAEFDEDELRRHLQNIMESFDDELLTSFITQYDGILDKIRVIDEVIKQKCNED